MPTSVFRTSGFFYILLGAISHIIERVSISPEGERPKDASRLLEEENRTQKIRQSIVLHLSLNMMYTLQQTRIVNNGAKIDHITLISRRLTPNYRKSI